MTRNFIIKTTIALATLSRNAVLAKTGTLTQNSVSVIAKKNAVMAMAMTLVKTQLTANATLKNSAAKTRTIVQTKTAIAWILLTNSAAQDRTIVQTKTAHARKLPTNSAAQNRTIPQTQSAIVTLRNSAVQDRILVQTQNIANVQPTNTAVVKTVQLIKIANVIVTSAVAMGITGPIHIAPNATHYMNVAQVKTGLKTPFIVNAIPS